MEKIFIAPSSFKKTIITEYLKSNIFSSVHVYSKEDLIDFLYPWFKSKSINLLMKEFDFSYLKAKNYLFYLRFFDISKASKMPLMNEIYRFLKDNKMVLFDEFAKQLVIGKTIDVYGYYSDDKFLQFLLKKLQITPNFIKNHGILQNNKCYIYDTIEEECHHLFINILKCYNDGVSLNDIYIYGYSNEYKFYFDYYSNLYNLPINNFPKFNFYSLNFVKVFLKQFKRTNNIDLCLNDIEKLIKNNHELFIQFKDLVVSNFDQTLSNAQQLDIFKEVFKSKNNIDVFDNAVTIINDYTYIKNKHIFCIGFNQNSYPKIKFDTDVIFDSDKRILNVPTSEEENLINKLSLVDFLKSDNTFYFSFANKSYTNNYYLSFIALNNNFEIIKKCEDLFDYSKVSSLNFAMKSEDIFNKYGKKDNYLTSFRKSLDYSYNSYDNQFKKFSIFNDKSKLRYSYSSLNSFAKCPFSYYLQYVLKISENETTFSLQLGNFVHEIFLIGLKNNNYNFEEIFNTCLYNNKYQFTPKELFIINGLKSRMHQVFNFNSSHKNKIKNAKFYLEKSFSFNLTENSIFEGRIDKLIVTNNSFYSIVDYKTGNISLDINMFKYGLDLQLISYGMLINYDQNFSHLSLAGLYYQTVFNKVNDDNEKHYKLNGLSLYNPIYLTDFAYNEFVLNKKSNMISESEFDQHINTCLNQYLSMDKKIRNNDFLIAPLCKGKSFDSCIYCKFKDICFVKNNQRLEIGKNVEEEEDYNDESF